MLDLYASVLSFLEHFCPFVLFGLAIGYLPFFAAASRVHPFCNLQRRARTYAVLVIGLYELLGAAASDTVYQLLAYGRWFSPGTPASYTTKTGRHDIAEILLKVALNTIIQIKSHLWLVCIYCILWFQPFQFTNFYKMFVSHLRKTCTNSLKLQRSINRT
jgi:uncharacterized membrane protein